MTFDSRFRERSVLCEIEATHCGGNNISNFRDEVLQVQMKSVNLPYNLSSYSDLHIYEVDWSMD